MSDIALRVEGLGKRYRLGLQGNAADGMYRYKSLRDSLGSVAKHPLRTLRDAVVRKPMDEDNSFWALKDVNFEVKKGEVVGIIGRNGAGKSTLLKVLSRITKPTTGRVDLFGRVGSLLEVGTGFHPELSGRENIYLNGAVLGMTRSEVTAKFNEIVNFSEVARFLDTPVKQYSSGMYTRLAFAIAAHLEAEILIVDEVLAVGDAQFQQRCLGKMTEIARGGRTVLFVSHNMAAVEHLCHSAILLQDGCLRKQGDVGEVTYRYLTPEVRNKDASLPRCRASWAVPYITSLRVTDGNLDTDCIRMGGRVAFDMHFDSAGCRPPLKNPAMGVVIHHATRGVVAGVNTRMTGFIGPITPVSAGHLRCMIPSVQLLPGQYRVDIWLGDGPANIDLIEGHLTFQVEAADVYQSGQTPFADLGVMYLQPEWALIDEAPSRP